MKWNNGYKIQWNYSNHRKKHKFWYLKCLNASIIKKDILVSKHFSTWKFSFNFLIANQASIMFFFTFLLSSINNKLIFFECEDVWKKFFMSFLCLVVILHVCCGLFLDICLSRPFWALVYTFETGSGLKSVRETYPR